MKPAIVLVLTWMLMSGVARAAEPFDASDPMESPAGAERVQKILAEHPGQAMLVFCGDRVHPSRLADELPQPWAERGPAAEFSGTSQPGEFYVFQVGVLAGAELRELGVSFGELRSASGQVIPASALRCFNLGGIDWTGRPFTKRVDIERGKLATLWIGVQVPKELPAGRYEGVITLMAREQAKLAVTVKLEVAGSVLEDCGDSEPWRHSRLRWLDSTLAVDDEVVAPFTAVQVEGRRVSILGRSVEIGESGLPRSIQSYFDPAMTKLRSEADEILAGPMALVVEGADGSIAKWTFQPGAVERRGPGLVVWPIGGSGGEMKLRGEGRLEFDGCLQYRMGLSAGKDVEVRDVRLEIPLRPEASRYLMGMNQRGGERPARLEWKWDRSRHQDSVWVGSAHAGLRCQLLGENYIRPFVNIHYHHKPLNLPPAWHNEGKGGCTVAEEGAGDARRVVLRAYSGARTLRAGSEQHFDFNLLVTPFKTLDTASQWKVRYYHQTGVAEPEQVKRQGATIINIHQGNDLNTYINYPFLTADKMRQYVDKAHAAGLKVKTYYTVRELTNHTVELWALRALGYEVLADGPGGGDGWLQQHLRSHYIPAWAEPRTHDASIITSGMSRWHNYYVEGLAWMLRNTQIDGLYIDDVAYDREVMKRVRKVLDRQRPGSLIDLHSWNHFNDRAGFASCANLYMEHMPYLNRIWFGEGFDYNSAPDYWLVEISGIPYGMMGEMLEGGGNPWRGMVYGMTGRLGWGGDPTQLWKLWDSFGMEGAEMIGYWTPNCPVKTDNAKVLATVYQRKGAVLVALASWAPQKVNCRLTVDWKRLGLDPAKVKWTAPAVEKFQPAATFGPDEAIPVEPGRGWLLIASES